MRELLVVCPRMPPWNGADAQRVRMMLPYLHACGWRASVVALDTASDAGSRDEALAATIPEDAQIVRVRAWSRAIAGRCGLRQVSLRAWWPLRQALASLQGKRKFDAGLMSNTDFPLWPLSLRWPFPVLLDWQDPWLSTYYDEHPNVEPPGGRFRYGVMQALARRFEPRVARHAAAHLTVSAAYRTTLCARYPDLDPGAFETVPFGASAADLALARRSTARPEMLQGRARWWVYAGRGGPDMHFAAGALFAALAIRRKRHPEQFHDFGMLFVGTAYDARQSSAPLAALACEHGVGDLVVERPQRVGLVETYRLLDAAEAIVVPGSDDPAYVASKLAPCLLTGRPLLAAFHDRSAAHALANVHTGTLFIGFDPTAADGSATLRDAMLAQWFDVPRPQVATAVDLGELDAAAMTRRICRVLDHMVERQR